MPVSTSPDAGNSSSSVQTQTGEIITEQGQDQLQSILSLSHVHCPCYSREGLAFGRFRRCERHRKHSGLKFMPVPHDRQRKGSASTSGGHAYASYSSCDRACMQAGSCGRKWIRSQNEGALKQRVLHEAGQNSDCQHGLRRTTGGSHWHALLGVPSQFTSLLLEVWAPTCLF